MTKQMQIVNGAEMISRAAIDAGVNFFAGYPITPASSVYTAMLRKLQSQGKIAIGASDEISGIAMCLGAAMRGAKSMSSTAAPGFALMVESLAYAFMTETPFLLVLGQRMGPSTGAATQSAEGDISMVTNFISGGYRIPVIAPNSIFNCYEMTMRAINISEKYRTPVILLTEKDIIMSLRNVDVSKLPKIEVIDRKAFEGEVFKPYNFNELEGVPEFVPAGGSEHKAIVTGSMHDKEGNLLKNAPAAMEVLDHLKAKIEGNVDDMAFFEMDKSKAKGDVCVISFLASDLSAREAIAKARDEGMKINHLTLFTLMPILEKQIKEAIEGCHTVVIPEENIFGQYASLISHLLEGKKVIRVNHQGSLITPTMVYDAIKEGALAKA